MSEAGPNRRPSGGCALRSTVSSVTEETEVTRYRSFVYLLIKGASKEKQRNSVFNKKLFRRYFGRRLGGALEGD